MAVDNPKLMSFDVSSEGFATLDEATLFIGGSALRSLAAVGFSSGQHFKQMERFRALHHILGNSGNDDSFLKVLL